MKKKKLKKLLGEIRSLRQRAGSVLGRELANVAKKLGRYPIKGGGGHTQYGTDLRPGRVTISSHSKPLKRRTTLSILDELEADVFYWRELLAKQEGTSDASEHER